MRKRNHKKYIIVSLVIIFIFLLLLSLAKVWEWDNYNKRICQITGTLNEKYEGVSFSIKNVEYARYYGPLTEIIPYGSLSYDMDKFYLYDEKYKFDFTVNINNSLPNKWQDDYVNSYCSKRITDICLNNISVPYGCEVSFSYSVIQTTDESLQSLKELSDGEIVEMLVELKNNGHGGVHYKGVVLDNSSIELNIAINGNEKDAQETAYQIYDYMINAFNETYISELTINNRTVIKKQWFGMNTDSHFYGHDQYFLNKEEFMELIS